MGSTVKIKWCNGNCLEGKHCSCLCVDRVEHILLTIWYVKIVVHFL